MAYFYSPFRKQYTAGPTTSACPFCAGTAFEKQIIQEQGHPFENEHYRWVVNAFPKFEGHTMLIPKRHICSFAEETADEVAARHALLLRAIQVLQTKYPGCGIEYFTQTGPGSASSVAHLHWHVVPASPDDELRSFEKLGHFYTTDTDEQKIVLFPKTITMSPDELLHFLST